MPNPLKEPAHGNLPTTFASFGHLREILDCCPTVTVVLNEQRQIVYFNRALVFLSGSVEKNALFGEKFGDAVQCAQASGGEGCGTTAACQTCGAFLGVTDGLKGLASSKECRLIRNVDGRTEWVDVQVSVSPIAADGERFAACFVRDISHEKRREVLERIFFHDILNSATGVELLARALKTMVEGDASSFALQIRSCANQMVEEILSQQQLLSAEKDELAVTVVCLNTGSVVLEALDAARGSELAEKRVLRVAAGSHEVMIETDPSILRRVLRNMLLNALEASREEETIEVGCRDDGDEVEFWVHNPGVITEPVRRQIFQRSFSTKGTGRGLGTYSMKLLSERYLKGTVTFRSTTAEGTHFFARYHKRLRPGSHAAQSGDYLRLA